MDYDLAIVGCGSVGAAAGYYAALAGLRVALFDSGNPPHRLSGHHGDTRIMHHAIPGPAFYTPLVLRAQQLWRDLEEISGLPLFHRSGVLSLAPRYSAFLTGIQASASRHHLAHILLSREALSERWPVLRVPEDYRALLEPNAGYLKCHLAVATLIEKAVGLGADRHFECPLHALQTIPSGVRLCGSKGAWSARRVAVCAGVWSQNLLPGLPLRTRYKSFAWYQADDRFGARHHFPALHTLTPQGAFFYSFPAVSGTLKTGRYDEGGPVSAPDGRIPCARDRREAPGSHDYLHDFLPQTGHCLYGDIASVATTPDNHFIIDTLPASPAISVVCGLGVQGFKLAPVLGEILVRMAMGRPTGHDLRPFSLSRFPSGGTMFPGQGNTV